MNSNKSVIALGKFDGIHLGHRALISAAVERARSTDAQALVYAIGTPQNGAIITRSEKDTILKEMGIDNIIYKTLDDVLRNMLPEEFVESILVQKLCASCVVVGEDFRFGRSRCASCRDLARLCGQSGVETVIIPTVRTTYCGRAEDVSSSAIRDYLSRGCVDGAAKHLGRMFSVSGIVENGKHLGRKMGFPTINILPDAEKLMPASGVYAAYAHIGDRAYRAITNVGTNPTVESGDVIKIETHIFDEEINCYGENVTICFARFIRGERRFDGVDELAGQINDDKEKARRILSEYERVGQDGF